MTVWNSLLLSLKIICDTLKLNKYSAEVLPLYERYLEKHPSEIVVRIYYTYSLQFLKKKDEADQQLDIVLKSNEISGIDYYNVACVYSQLNEPKPAIQMLSLSFAKGYDVAQMSQSDPDFNNIRNLPQFKAKIKEMERAKLSSQ